MHDAVAISARLKGTSERDHYTKYWETRQIIDYGETICSNTHKRTGLYFNGSIQRDKAPPL